MELQSRGYIIVKACKVMNDKNTITMRNNRKCCFVISRSRAVCNLKQRNMSIFFSQIHAKRTIKSKEHRDITNKTYNNSCLVAEKTYEKENLEKKKKKNVYEKPFKSKQDKDITKITYNSSYSMNIKFQKVIGKKWIMQGNNGYMNKQNGSASVLEQRVIYLCRRSV